MERDEVRLRAQLVKLQQLYVEVGRDLTGDEGVVRDGPHAKGMGPVHHFPADPTETDDPERLAP